MAQKILGLDLGAYALKAVLLEGSFRGFVVKRYLTVPVPQDRPGEARPLPERLAEALSALRESAGVALKAEAVYTAMPGGEVTTHLIALPFTDTRKIEQTLPFELEDQLPFDLDEVVFDHQILGQRGSATETLVGVVRREVLAGILGLLGENGLDPRVVSLTSLAYQNLFAHGVVQPLEGGVEGASRAEAVLDVGHTSTDLLIVENGAARFARTFPIAGRSLSISIAAAEKLELEDAERLKVSEGTLRPEADPRSQRLAEAIRRGLGPLVRGVRQSFMSYSARSRVRVERVLLAGGTARLPGLAEWLSEELGCEIVALDPFPAAATAPDVPQASENDPAGALAMALALRGQGGARTAKINFRKGPFAFKGDLSYLKGNVTRLSALAAVVLVLLGANVFARFETLEAREAKLDEALCALTEKVLGACTTDPDDAISRLKGQRMTSASIPKVSAAEILAEVASRLDDVEEVELSELDITGVKVRLQGTAGSFDGVSKVVDALRGYSCFGEVSQGQTRQARTGEKIEFNVDADVKAECASG